MTNEGPSLLQTESWKKLQDALGERSFFEHKKDWQFVAVSKKVPGGRYLYLPYGPYARTKTGFKNALEAAEALARSENAYFIRIEPQAPEIASEWLKRPEFVKSKDLDPAETWCLDLTAEKSAIISGFSQGTRTRYNTFKKKGLSVEVTRDPSAISELVRLQHKLAAEKGIGSFSEKYLRTELEQDFAELYLVRYHSPEAPQETKRPLPEDGQVIAASLFFDDGTTRYYMQSAADDDFKHLPATVAILTSSLFDAKEKGEKYMDFWGIAPDGAPKDHPWAGFTQFKKSFGGFEKKYCGTWDFVLNRRKYAVYKKLRRLNRLKRKLFR